MEKMAYFVFSFSSECDNNVYIIWLVWCNCDMGEISPMIDLWQGAVAAVGPIYEGDSFSVQIVGSPTHVEVSGRARETAICSPLRVLFSLLSASIINVSN